MAQTTDAPGTWYWVLGTKKEAPKGLEWVQGDAASYTPGATQTVWSCKLACCGETGSAFICTPQNVRPGDREFGQEPSMVKVAKTADRKRIMDTSKSHDCPKCGKPARIVKRVKDRERGVPGGIYISCSVCDFYEKL